jgi:hypothetical protein
MDEDIVPAVIKQVEWPAWLGEDKYARLTH